MTFEQHQGRSGRMAACTLPVIQLLYASSGSCPRPWKSWKHQAVTRKLTLCACGPCLCGHSGIHRHTNPWILSPSDVDGVGLYLTPIPYFIYQAHHHARSLMASVFFSISPSRSCWITSVRSKVGPTRS